MSHAPDHPPNHAQPDAHHGERGPSPGWLTTALLWLIAAVWVFAGVAKFVDLMVPTTNLDALASEPAWADQFPAWLIALVAAVEIAAGVAICAGWRRAGIATACALLTAFAITLWIIPPEPSQPCGCLGAADRVFDAVPAHAKIAAFGGLHALTGATFLPIVGPIAGKRPADPTV